MTWFFIAAFFAWLFWPYKRVCEICWGRNIEQGPLRNALSGYCWDCRKVTYHQRVRQLLT